MPFEHEMKNAETGYHVPVMRQEVIDWLAVEADHVIVDATLGGGGHTEAILNAEPHCRVVGLDADPDAIRFASERLKKFGERFIPRMVNFRDIKDVLSDLNIASVNGILMDLGVSSFQLDRSERGFSYRHDKPLDMRFSDRQTLTAARIIQTYPEAKLADIFFHYGEERHSRRIARAIVRQRGFHEIKTTHDLAEAVRSAVGPRFVNKTLSRVFQSLRIEVNGELENLKHALSAALSVLKSGGRIVVIAYHSLEDRIVKNFFKAHTHSERDPLELHRLTVLTKKPVVPSEEEVKNNPRARSAKLRVAERTI